MANYDVVNNPAHYTNGNIECIDAMESAFGSEELKTFCKLNAFKYLWRSEYKNGVEDIKKARWYIDKYIALCENNIESDFNDEENKCYADCKHFSDTDDEWCEAHCRCALCPSDPRYNSMPYMYQKA